MSSAAFCRLVEQMATDAAFRERHEAAPDAPLAEPELSIHERIALHELSPPQLHLAFEMLRPRLIETFAAHLPSP